MSQHDMDVANQIFPATRTDLNAALVALATLSSGATTPATTFAYQVWADTTANVLRRRNAANSAWLAVRSLDETTVLSRAANTILAGSDLGKAIIATAAFTQTLTAAATLADGWFVDLNAQGFSIVIDPNGAELIDGAATKTVTGSGRIYCNGSAFFTIGFTVVSGAATSLSGTGATVTADAPVISVTQTWNNSAIAFTGIKSNITNTASAAGALLMDFQVGGSSRISTTATGLTKMVGSSGGGIWVDGPSSSTFAAMFQGNSSNNSLRLLNTAGNAWVPFSALSFSAAGTGTIGVSSSSNPETLSAAFSYGGATGVMALGTGAAGSTAGTLSLAAIILDKTITAGGTTGAQTINKPTGSVNFAAAATSLVVTNSLVATTSVINCTVGTNDSTMKSVVAVAAAGSFTIFANAAANAETRVNFRITN